jgi:hypothetical protein
VTVKLCLEVKTVVDELARRQMDQLKQQQSVEGSEVMPKKCSICEEPLAGRDARGPRYPAYVCHACGDRAVNEAGETPDWWSNFDSGENLVFIDGIKCWRRCRFGGFVTMRDEQNCSTLGEFYEKNGFRR